MPFLEEFRMLLLINAFLDFTRARKEVDGPCTEQDLPLGTVRISTRLC